jgi:uncharacterized protein (TIGR02217 family)
MQFVDVQFPDCIAFGAQSDSTWSTDVAAVLSGHEITNQNWEDARHLFDVSFAVRTASDYRMVRTHFHEVRGRAKAFPFKDFLDFSALATEGVMLLDDSDSPPGDYQMYKRYGSGAYAYDRKITRPVSGTITVFRTRAAVTTTIAATIDYSTGLVTVTGHVVGDIYTWSGNFNVPVRYDTDRLPAMAINKESEGELLVQCGSIPICEVRE